MTSYVSTELRRLVATRARRLCEYCLVHERDTYLGCQVDHIISEKHGGATRQDNLAFACTFCNRSRGTDIGSYTLMSGAFTRFFNPRIDHWGDHFVLKGVEIVGVTLEGEATARILGFNEFERILERRSLQDIGRYPPREARRLLMRR